MAKSSDSFPAQVNWERVSATWYSSSIGYVQKSGELWDAHVYRNQRAGKLREDSQPGFRTLLDAKRWVEREAED